MPKSLISRLVLHIQHIVKRLRDKAHRSLTQPESIDAATGSAEEDSVLSALGGPSRMIETRQGRATSGSSAFNDPANRGDSLELHPALMEDVMMVNQQISSVDDTYGLYRQDELHRGMQGLPFEIQMAQHNPYTQAGPGPFLNQAPPRGQHVRNPQSIIEEYERNGPPPRQMAFDSGNEIPLPQQQQQQMSNVHSVESSMEEVDWIGFISSLGVNVS